MGWDTVVGIGIIFGILGLITYVVLKLLAYGEQRGVEKTLLEIEIANREAREKIDEVARESEEEYDKALDATTDLDFDDVNRLLFDEDSSETSTVSA